MRKIQNKSGFSLIEVIVTILLLAALVLGGSAVMSLAGGGIQRQQNKREALVTANSIMEQVWNRSYTYLQANAGSAISTNAVVNGINMAGSVNIGAESTDADGNKYLELRVEIDHLSASDDVVVITRRYKYGISRAAL